ncbi:MAG: transglutaminaseTgpA domain-containing protein [Intrasporangium sp.]|uniref:transglutaminase family protein n=1 Tax=Intrasporangium sp. TaxID=1925024 RepID=UPI003F818A65
MTRRRWRITILGALATLAAAYPVTSLFSSTEWFSQVTVFVALTAAIGLVMRGLTASRPAVVAVQLVVVGYVIVWRFGQDTLSGFLPTRETWDGLGFLATEAYETIQRYTAPAPLTAGVTFCLVVIGSALAIAVDALAATWRAPAAAGLPLLTAYLITAANGSEALDPRYFVLPVVLWLAMLHTTARSRFMGWSTTTSVGQDDTGYDGVAGVESHSRQAERSFSGGAVRLGLIGLVLALIVPVLVPHFPPRYLAEGLGRSGGAGGTGTVGFANTLDLTKSLTSSDQTPVLSYTTTGPRPPLRVLATSLYSSDGEWVGDVDDARGPGVAPPTRGKDYTMTVSNNTLRAPNIAAPYPVVAVSMEGIPWRQNPVTGDIRVGEAVSSYRVTYADAAPLAAQLEQASPPTGPEVRAEDLEIPDVARGTVISWSDQVTRGKQTELDKAIAIQDHLRDTSIYTYSLDLPDRQRDKQGRFLDPITNFRVTKVGYCVQFATAMVMLARAQGIPARMAIGFLPGEQQGEEYVVRASDAHAWPELYFAGFGWLRFEPTPGARSGAPPAYTIQGATPGSTGAGQQAPEPGKTTAAPSRTGRPGLDQPNVVAPEPTLWDQVTGFITLRGVLTLVGLGVALLAVFAMPITAALMRRRRRRRAVTQQDLVEADWDDLTSHLRDLGIDPPEGGTLRTWRNHVIRDGHLDEANATAVRRVTATLERTRYDRPERTTAEQTQALHEDIRSIRRHVGRTRAMSTRARAFLWPEAGVSVWRRLAERFTGRG